MKSLSYVLLILAVVFAASLLAAIGWAALHADWSHKVFSAAFWTADTEDVRNAALVVGGVAAAFAAAIGLPLAAVRSLAAATQARVAEHGHITDRFTKAVEQLDNDKLEVRLGAIYALGRIAQDSKRDHWPIMETLTAYVRERAPWPARIPTEHPSSKGSAEEQVVGWEESLMEEQAKPAIDVQAVLTVIGRRNSRHDIKGQRLDLSGTDLRRARLDGSQLEEADLFTANLKEAVLVAARLAGARLNWARLEGAYLHQADLKGASLAGALLRGTHPAGADLRGTEGLIQEQLDAALGDEHTKLPDGLVIPREPPGLDGSAIYTIKRG